VDEVQERLRVALRAAMKARDTVAMSALRSVIAAIGNAAAISLATSHNQATTGDQHFAGSAAGLGAAEAQRRELSASDVAGVVAAEAAERRAAATQYEASGHPGRAARLRREAEVIEAALA
jgi:hypothetical protein